MSKIDYKKAGVDIDAGNEAVERIKENVKTTFTPNVLTGLGSFGSLFSLKDILKDYKDPVLVQSIDGVGTKTIFSKNQAPWNQMTRNFVCKARLPKGCQFDYLKAVSLTT